MNYSLIKERRFLPKADRARAISNLKLLRKQLSDEIPAKDTEEHMLLATWNVRDFGKPEPKRKGYGPRLGETHFYIAEVISRFDFVAVQEVNDLPEWDRVMDILGPDWGWIATDVTDPALGGNGERLTFVYDERKVRFRNIAGEIVMPPGALVSENVVPEESDAHGARADVAGTQVGRQFARSPFVASFRAGWFRFDICTVHVYYGTESGPKLARRIEEIRAIAQYFGMRAAEALEEKRSLILLGDFNIVNPKHKTMTALLDAGFETAPALKDARSNVLSNKHYDQIAFRADPRFLDYVDTPTPDGKKRAGVFDIFANVLSESQFSRYKSKVQATAAGNKKSGDELRDYYLDWRTYQFSDHKPMWLQLRVNDSERYIETLPK
jgi:endonuclease/exonuclease/phosphatase family metal-dependent hydrolase